MNKNLNGHSSEIEFEISDDVELLDIMLDDSIGQSSLYIPGSYWIKNTINSVKEIKRCGLADFRGASNSIGQGYADNTNTEFVFRMIVG